LTAANASITQFVADVAEITPSLTSTMTQILGLLLVPPLVIFVAVAFFYAGVRIGMSLWRKLRH